MEQVREATQQRLKAEERNRLAAEKEAEDKDRLMAMLDGLTNADDELENRPDRMDSDPEIEQMAEPSPSIEGRSDPGASTEVPRAQAPLTVRRK